MVTADGEEIGKVKEATVATNGTIVSLDINPGWFKDEQTIPAHFIDRVEEGRVVLAVGQAVVRQLER